MSVHQEVATLKEAIEIARAFAASGALNEANAEAFAETWFDAGKDIDASSPNDLRCFLARRFGIKA